MSGKLLTGYHINKYDSYSSMINELIKCGWTEEFDIKIKDIILLTSKFCKLHKFSIQIYMFIDRELMEESFLSGDKTAYALLLLEKLQNKYLDYYWDYVKGDLETAYRTQRAQPEIGGMEK